MTTHWMIAPAGPCAPDGDTDLSFYKTLKAASEGASRTTQQMADTTG